MMVVGKACESHDFHVGWNDVERTPLKRRYLTCCCDTCTTGFCDTEIAGEGVYIVTLQVYT